MVLRRKAKLPKRKLVAHHDQILLFFLYLLMVSPLISFGLSPACEPLHTFLISPSTCNVHQFFCSSKSLLHFIRPVDSDEASPLVGDVR